MVQQWLHGVLAATSEHAVIFVSLEGVILEWLGASARLFGYARQEALGMPMKDLFVPEDAAAGFDQQDLALATLTGRSEGDRWHVRKDGTRFWSSGVMELVHDEAGSAVGLCKILRDRTDVRAELETLQRNLSASQEENAQRLTFLVWLSHELRNQLNLVATTLALLQQSVDKDLNKRAHARLERQLKVTTKLLHDLSEAAHRNVLQPTVQFQTIPLQDALQHAASSMADVVAAKMQSLTIVSPQEPLDIEADPQRLHQMLVNLLNNASKYSHEGGQIQLSASVEGDMVAIRVEDNGMGIANEVLPRVFDLFMRDARVHGDGGLGVGLPIVNQLAKLHNGWVEAQSPGPAKGSIFTIHLPRQQPAHG